MPDRLNVSLFVSSSRVSGPLLSLGTKGTPTSPLDKQHSSVSHQHGHHHQKTYSHYQHHQSANEGKTQTTNKSVSVP